MQPDRVVILGASGFVGRSLTEWLSASGTQVSLVARSERPQWSVRRQVEYCQASIDDSVLLDSLLAGSQWVVHLACESVPGTASGPTAEASGNLLPTLRLLETLQRFPSAKLLYISTGGAIYGDTRGQAVDEGVEIAPFSYYAAGKASIEAFIHAFCHQNGREAVILRPSNLYGPGQAVRPGFGIIPALLHAAATGDSLDIWGDGSTVRDFLYMTDFLDLVRRIFDAPPHAAIGTYNAGSGVGHSLNSLCEQVEAVSGRKLRPEYRAARRVDVSHIVLDSARAQHEFGWTASTGLREGLVKTWTWFTESQR